MTSRDRAAGITLVEMLVSLVLFALVGLASFTTLDAIIRVRDRTEGRLELIARYDRALLLFSRDVMQSAPTGIRMSEGELTLARPSGMELIWALRNGSLVRQAGRPGKESVVGQELLEDIDTVQFRFLDDATQWTSDWPNAAADDVALHAIEMTLALDNAKGDLVRLAEVTAQIPAELSLDFLTDFDPETPLTDDQAPSDDPQTEGN